MCNYDEQMYIWSCLKEITNSSSQSQDNGDLQIHSGYACLVVKRGQSVFMYMYVE